MVIFPFYIQYQCLGFCFPNNWTNKYFQLQEIQKIVVFEGAFEKIFSIIKEEGGSDGGVVVQVIYLILCIPLQCSEFSSIFFSYFADKPFLIRWWAFS